MTWYDVPHVPRSSTSTCVTGSNFVIIAFLISSKMSGEIPQWKIWHFDLNFMKFYFSPLPCVNSVSTAPHDLVAHELILKILKNMTAILLPYLLHNWRIFFELESMKILKQITAISQCFFFQSYVAHFPLIYVFGLKKSGFKGTVVKARWPKVSKKKSKNPSTRLEIRSFWTPSF